MKMTFEHDPRADAVYLRVSDREWASQQNLDDERVMDFDDQGRLIGIELLCVSHGVDSNGLPLRDEVERVLSAHGIRILLTHPTAR